MKKVTLVFLYIFLFIGVKAQYNKVIMEAMKDELQRNMDELQYKDFKEPFFIQYDLFDLNLDMYVSSLGGLTYQRNNKRKSSDIRVMVGDYQVTDENFQDKTNRFRHNDGHISLPYEADYDGIRQHFWLLTNNVYKNASELYKNKLASLKQQNMSLDELPANDLSKENVSTFVIDKLDKGQEEIDLLKLSNSVSAIFVNFPKIINSEVTVKQWDLFHYFVNSEGTTMAQPSFMIELEVVASAYSPDNEIIKEKLKVVVNTTDELPKLTQLEEKVKLFAGNLLEKSELPVWTDSYTGPIVLEDQAIYQLLLRKAFVPGKGVIAQREPLIKDKEKGLYLANNTTLEAKVGKKVCASNITVLDNSVLKSYKGKNLIGSRAYDCEGVKTSDSTVIVEDGILKSLLLNRIPLKKFSKSTGHSALSFSTRQMRKAIGPGNIFVKSNESKSKEELYSHLKSLGEEEGLEYVIIVRSSLDGDVIGPLDYYKVDLATGKEEKIRAVNTSKLDVGSFRDIVAVSDKEVVHNVIHSYAKSKRSSNYNLASFIYPDAFLIEDVELRGYNKPIQKNAPIIPNPLN